MGLVVVVVEVLVVVVGVVDVVVEVLVVVVVEVLVVVVVDVVEVLVVVVGTGKADVDGVGSTGMVGDETGTARFSRGRTWRWVRRATVRRAGAVVAVEVGRLWIPAGVAAGLGVVSDARATRVSAVATTKPSATQATWSRRRGEVVGSQGGTGSAGELSPPRVRRPRRV